MVRLDGRMMPHWSTINIADNSDRSLRHRYGTQRRYDCVLDRRTTGPS
jgi:hypothetical protein